MGLVQKSLLEAWEIIPEYEGLYEVSNMGRVRSLDRSVKGKDGVIRFHKGRTLRGSIGNSGYLRITLCKNGDFKYFSLHQLVLMAFTDYTPGNINQVVDHINNVKTDNRLENLQVITQRENTSKDKTGKASKYVGVTRNTKGWRARIRINGELVNIGTYKSEYEAAKAYESKLKEL